MKDNMSSGDLVLRFYDFDDEDDYLSLKETIEEIFKFSSKDEVNGVIDAVFSCDCGLHTVKITSKFKESVVLVFDTDHSRNTFFHIFLGHLENGNE